MRLVWGHGNGIANNGLAVFNITTKPPLSFQFDGLFYSDDNNIAIATISVGRFYLSDAQKQEVVEYISNLS